MQLRMLVFPAPLGPMTASISPSFTSKLTPERADTPPKFNQISLTFNLMEMFLSFYNKEGNTRPHPIKSNDFMSIEK